MTTPQSWADRLNIRSEQTLVADTGWRGLSTSYGPAWPTTEPGSLVVIRRIGSLVSLVVPYTEPSVSTSFTFSVNDEGFSVPRQCSQYAPLLTDEGVPGSVNDTNLYNALKVYNSGFGRIEINVNFVIPYGQASMQWVTDSPWPSTLPGVPA